MKTEELFEIAKPAWGCSNPWIETTHKLYPFHALCLLDYLNEGAEVRCECCNEPCPSFDGGTQFGRMWVLANWHSANEIQFIGDCCWKLVPKLGMDHRDQVHGQSKAVVMPEQFANSPIHQAVKHQFLGCDKKYLGSAFPNGIKSLKDLQASFSSLGGYHGPELSYKQDGRRFVIYSDGFTKVVAKLTESQVVEALNDILRNQGPKVIQAGYQLSLF